MPPRTRLAPFAALAVLLLPGPVPAQGDVSPAVQDWLSAFITKIDAADRARRSSAGGKATGTVVVHVEVAADGSVRKPEVEKSSGSAALDRRALDALRAVSPFTPPPPELLTEAGVTDLSFPLQLGR